MKNLLVAIDFSDVSMRLISIAKELAGAFEAKVWLMHCVGENEAVGTAGEIPMFLPVSADAPLRERFPEEHRKLLAFCTLLQRAGIDVEPVLVSGSAIDNILTAADEHRVELIIMGSHGHGALYELMVGTVTKSALQRAGRPILVIPCAPEVPMEQGNKPREHAFTGPEFFGLSE